MAISLQASSQPGYRSMMKSFQNDYVRKHEVVKEKDKKYFRFFPVDQRYMVTADFERIYDTTGFIMKTSGKKTPKYYKYGRLNFRIRDTLLHLTVYQSENLKGTEEYKDYLFVLYTDLTSGEESYGGGKYIEFYINDIRNNKVILDFNKAYNPYCAYATGYNCPIPPRENDLNIAIRAGEKMFAKKH
jgi:uncharacterized protein (DUF1684 family)